MFFFFGPNERLIFVVNRATKTKLSKKIKRAMYKHLQHSIWFCLFLSRPCVCLYVCIPDAHSVRAFILCKILFSFRSVLFDQFWKQKNEAEREEKKNSHPQEITEVFMMHMHSFFFPSTSSSFLHPPVSSSSFESSFVLFQTLMSNCFSLLWF